MRKNHAGLAIGLVAVAAIGLLGWNSFRSSGSVASGGGERVACVNPNLPVLNEYHIHPVLKIVTDGKETPVPANIGLSDACHRVLHTHDGTGTIHVEPNFYKEYTLGDFFWVWGKPFFKEGYQTKMTVDGVPSEEYENLVLRDQQQIVIEYTAVSAPQTESL